MEPAIAASGVHPSLQACSLIVIVFFFKQGGGKPLWIYCAGIGKQAGSLIVAAISFSYKEDEEKREFIDVGRHQKACSSSKIRGAYLEGHI